MPRATEFYNHLWRGVDIALEITSNMGRSGATFREYMGRVVTVAGGDPTYRAGPFGPEVFFGSSGAYFNLGKYLAPQQGTNLLVFGNQLDEDNLVRLWGGSSSFEITVRHDSTSFFQNDCWAVSSGLSWNPSDTTYYETRRAWVVTWDVSDDANLNQETIWSDGILRNKGPQGSVASSPTNADLYLGWRNGAPTSDKVTGSIALSVWWRRVLAPWEIKLVSANPRRFFLAARQERHLRAAKSPVFSRTYRGR